VEDFWLWLIALLTGGGLLAAGGGVAFAVAMSACACLAALAAGGGIALWFYRKRLQPAQALKRAAQAWPSVTGTVVASTVATETTYDTSSPGNTLMRFVPQVTFEYEVGGRRYRGETLRASDRFYSSGMTPGQAQGVVNRYPAGRQVPVYYDPQDPRISMLER
jgi:hypothetical protein